MNKKPLSGIKILDFTRLLPGPMCTLHLADMGAEVIKIEDLTFGDYARQVSSVGGQRSAIEGKQNMAGRKKDSDFFISVNRSKRSLAVDLTKAEGRELVSKLAETADVLVESFRPGVADKLGIGYEALRKINPRLIYCSITGYGQTGPWKDKAGHDINFCASAGVLDRKGKFPFLPNFQISDIVGGTLNAAMGILAALVQQKMSGEGQYLDVSIMDGVLAHSTLALAQIKNKTEDFLTGDCPCYTIYETSDHKFMALGALELKFWERFCKAVGRLDLVDSHTLESRAAGESGAGAKEAGANAEKLHKELVLLFKSNTREYWTNKLKDVDCCVSPVLSLEEAIVSEQVRARNMLVNAANGDVWKDYSEDEVPQFAPPVKFSNYHFSLERSAPMHGEHTEKILSDLGYSKIEIEGLRERKIIL